MRILAIPFLQGIGQQVNGQLNVNKPLVLNEGQLIYGQIRRLFPGQLAEVQIGEQKMMAKMEVPMRAGESYYFQVTSVNPDVQLKVMSGPVNARGNAGQQIQNLIQVMQLPNSNEMTSLLTFVIENKMPITRENLLQAVKFLQMTPSSLQNEALLSIQKLVELKMPFTQSIFQTIFSVEAKEGLHTVIDALKATLVKDPLMSSQMKTSIIQQIDNANEPLTQAKGYALLGHALKIVLDSTQNAELRFSMIQLLRESNIFPKQTSIPNLPNTLASLVASRAGTSEVMHSHPMGNIMKYVSELSYLSEEEKNRLLALVGRGQQPNASNNQLQNLASTLVKRMGENLAANPLHLSSKNKHEIMTLLSGNEQTITTASDKIANLLRSAEQSESASFQKLLQIVEATITKAIDGKMMKETIQSIFRSLGLNYEAALMTEKEGQINRLAHTLKPQLLALINDTAVSSNVREIAEQVIVRMNATPLLSVESAGNQQLIMQIPLAFFGKKIDATLQWNSRMDRQGKIDADFARILFYLNLHALKETVVDMHVQSRVITITIFNENPNLTTIGSPLQEKLKDGLALAGYKLSGVFFKNYEDVQKKNLTEKVGPRDGEGVDFRI